MTVSEIAAAAFAVLLVGPVFWRAGDDAAHPKLLLVRAEWSCRRSHVELDARPVQRSDGSDGREIGPVMVCDDWSRR